jgi:iron complex transport system substrate-binding protein
MRRIVSFLPSATEMACALGLGDQLLGVTHECDFPLEVKEKPVVVRSALATERMTQKEIDVAVAERLRNGASIYEIDERALKALAPDLILTQDLCQVCAPSGNEVTQLLNALVRKPDILWMTPKSVEGIFDNMRELGEITGRSARAEALIASSRERLAKIASLTRELSRRPRVFCMEWVDPPYCSGHWVPEMVEIAGGVDRLGRKDDYSVRIAWDEIRDWAPEVLLVMPCGCDLRRSLKEAASLFAAKGWADIPAVRQGRAYAVDANSYFARPGPRVVDGTELLAHLLHPELFAWHGPADAFASLSQRTAGSA